MLGVLDNNLIIGPEDCDAARVAGVGLIDLPVAVSHPFAVQESLTIVLDHEAIPVRNVIIVNLKGS